jgi:DNA replication protein DnaC
MTDLISTDLKAVMRRLRLGKLLDTLPERLALARQHKMPHQDFLFTLLSDECQRRDAAATTTRAQRALLDPEMMLERWDRTAKVTYDETLLAELVSLRFVDAHRHATIVGPVGVGKTFIAHALGHIACRRGFTVLALRADRLLKMLKHARLDHSHEAELRKLLAIDVLIIDDFCLDTMDAIESRDVHEILTERDRAGSVVITSNRGPDEWLPTFADPIRAQAAIDRFTSNAYDLVIEGESYRKRLKPKSPGSGAGQKKGGSGN